LDISISFALQVAPHNLPHRLSLFARRVDFNSEHRVGEPGRSLPDGYT